MEFVSLPGKVLHVSAHNLRIPTVSREQAWLAWWRVCGPFTLVTLVDSQHLPDTCVRLR